MVFSVAMTPSWMLYMIFSRCWFCECDTTDQMLQLWHAKLPNSPSEMVTSSVLVSWFAFPALKESYSKAFIMAVWQPRSPLANLMSLRPRGTHGRIWITKSCWRCDRRPLTENMAHNQPKQKQYKGKISLINCLVFFRPFSFLESYFSSREFQSRFLLKDKHSAERW